MDLLRRPGCWLPSGVLHAGELRGLRCLLTERPFHHCRCLPHRRLGLDCHDAVIFRLLLRCQRRVCPLQLQRLPHIFWLFSCDQLVAEFRAPRVESAPVVKRRQLINPLVLKYTFLELLQHGRLLIQADILRLIQLVLENEAPRIPRRHPDEFVVELKRPEILVERQLQKTHGINDLRILPVSLVRHVKHVSALRRAMVDLVKIADHTQRPDTFHSAPVDGIRNFHCLRVLILRDQRFDIFKADLILVFIQNCTSV